MLFLCCIKPKQTNISEFHQETYKIEKNREYKDDVTNITCEIEQEYKSRAFKSEYKSIIENDKPFISLFVNSYEINQYKNDDYAKFLFQLYTKVLLDTNKLKNNQYTKISNKHNINSNFIKYYVH